MCGICGEVLFSESNVNRSVIASMMQEIRHRGPDDEGIYLEDNVGFGFQRLSILDLSQAGHQPMSDSQGRYTIAFNGEIYNYLELRTQLRGKGYRFKSDSDTEVLLTAFIEWDRNCLDKLNGMFAFAVHDKQRRRTFIARDRYGIKPLYYYQNNKRLLFASEIQSILAVLGEGQIDPNYQSIFDYIAFNRTDQTTDTFFKNIQKLQHGHFIDIKEEIPQVSQWYDLKNNLGKPFESAEHYRDIFSSSVGLRLRSDVPVGVCLSGGLDSSSIVSTLLKDYQKYDLNTFSAVYGKGEKGDESDYINLYRNQLRNMHFVTPSADSLFADMHDFVAAHGEPVPSTSPYAQFKVMELAKDHVVVTLDGQGADEELAGYHYFFGNYFKELLYSLKLTKLASESFYYLDQHRSSFAFKTLAFFMLPESLKTKARVKEKGYIHNDFSFSYASGNVVAGELYDSKSLQSSLLNHFEYKLEHLLKWEDRNSMWFSLESRVPFLDYRLVEGTLSLPSERIINKGYTKQILREAMKGTLPEKIRMRQDKVGFGTPQDEWFRSEKFKGFIGDLIHSNSFASRGVFDTQKVQKLYSRHLNRDINISKEIWKWINMELWFRKFIDR